jgi:type I restriction enzyme S subunit
MAVMLGMTHDLLTRGIMPDGQLRPLRDDAPDLFKPAPFGWIPAEWDTRKCQEVCEKITVGIVVRPVQYYVDEGVPAFRSANVREDGLTAENLVFISERSNALLSKSQLRVGDVVSVRTGYPGTSAVIPEEFAGSNCIDILISRPSAAVRADYLASWINSSFGKDQVLRKQGGLAQQHFNVGELRELLIGLPPIEEQERIMARLGAISAQIRSETATRDKFLQIKEGLARDLLGLPAVGRRGREA